MAKRTTAIVFLLLANILLVVHALLPHHHHHKQVCLINSHCVDDNKAHEHNKNWNNHSHDGETNSDDCVLKQPIVVLTNQPKVDFRHNEEKSDQTSHDEYYNNVSNTRAGFPFSVFARHVPFLFNCKYSSLISASLGLRAPPVV